MKTNKLNIVFSLLAVLLLGFSACQPEEFTLGEMISQNDLKYRIVQDADDPNMVILQSLTEGVTPLWVTPMGRSTKLTDTVKIAFAGDYQFVYGVESAGGFVQADTFDVSITTNNFDYINNPLWENLTGGVGESKTWILDNGKYGLAVGPLSYADPNSADFDQVYEDYQTNWDPDGATSGATDADYASSMTFDLIGGPNLTSVKVNEGDVTETGTYSLNVEKHTLSTTDATIIRLPALIPNADNWTNELRVLELTENQLRIAVMRTNEEGPWFYVFNYVAKEYADNYEYAEPEPQLPENWEDVVTTVVSNKIKWVLSPETPFNWANLDGSLMNPWNSVADYPEWTGFNETIPETYEDFSLTMDAETNSVVFVAPDGTTQEGTYTLSDEGVYTFDGVEPAFTIVSWVGLSTTDENQWRILSVETGLNGNLKGMWVGKRDPVKPEYMAYHLIPLVAGGGNGGDQGTQLTFDNSKVATGNLEGEGDFRIELYNEFGSTVDDPPLNPEEVAFEDNIEVTFTIEGLTFVEGATGSYPADFQLADADWSAQYWGDGTASGLVSVTGDGTYTVTCNPGSTFDGALVFAIDIFGMAADITDLTAVNVTVEEIVMN